MFYINIAFWSKLRKKACVSSNMAAITSMLSIMQEQSIILLENHFNKFGIGNYFLEKEKIHSIYEKGNYCSKYGIEYLIRNLCTNCVSDTIFDKSSVTLNHSGLFYFPQSYLVNKEIFDYEFNLVMDELYSFLEKKSYAVCTDTESNVNITTNKILSKADLIVVCINQDIDDITSYMEEYSGISYKSVFVIGNYVSKAFPDKDEIQKLLGLPETRIGVIPYCSKFSTSLKKGTCLQFVKSNHLQAHSYENAYFMQELKRTTAIIADHIDRIYSFKKLKKKKTSILSVPSAY